MYERLLTGDRIRASTRGQKGISEEVESDRARVLYSAAFRRLQRKTQVFPLEDNASVRTRLTHSLEVAHVGRFLASSVLKLIRDQGLTKSFGLENVDFQHALSVTVEVACLLHDIGNPPFGHFGEFAISEWFRKKEPLSQPFADLRDFDGNPQGFRIVSRLNGADGLTGMNLTLSQLAATMKYPSNPDERERFKKFGVFLSEKDVMAQVRAKFNLQPEQRFPLAYLMEAADDISYCLSDIEDGVEKRIVSHKEIVADLLEQAPNDEIRALITEAKEAAEKASSVDEAVTFRSTLVRKLVEHAASTYISQHNEILAGEPKELIDENSAEGKLLSLIKHVVRNKVYTDSSIQSLELAGMSVITGLLEKFGRLLDLSRDEFLALLPKSGRVRGKDVEKRLVGFIADRHLIVYKTMADECSEIEEKWHRAHLIVDYISGMTDPFALKMHQTLGGTRL